MSLPTRSRARAIHPGAAAFTIAGIQVEIELADQFTVFSKSEKLNFGMPHWRQFGVILVTQQLGFFVAQALVASRMFFEKRVVSAACCPWMRRDVLSCWQAVQPSTS